jgi:hypothetical protein
MVFSGFRLTWYSLKIAACVWSSMPSALVAKYSRACGCQPGFSVAGSRTYSAAAGLASFQRAM